MPRSHAVQTPIDSRSNRSRASAPSSATTTAVAVGYLRRSTDRQEQSIPDQKRAIERFASERGYRMIRFYTDDAISGTSTIGRHAFQRLIADARRAERDFSTIIVYDVKRFGRIDNDEAGYYRHLLRSAPGPGGGVEVLYASENFSGDGTDDLLRPVKQWQAREESKDLAKVVIRGLLSKTEAKRGDSSQASGGWWMGGAPPFGYDLRYESQAGEGLFIVRMMPDGTKQLLEHSGSGALVRLLQRGETLAVSKRDRARLVPSEAARVKVIRQIFRMYVEQKRGFKGIADHLNRSEVPTPRGPVWNERYCGKWALTTVRAILLNPAYAGDLVWNRRTDARFSRISQGRAVERRGVVGRRLEPNPESDWIITRDAHPALVTRRVFELAQEIMRSKPESLTQQGINPRNPRPPRMPRSHQKSQSPPSVGTGIDSGEGPDASSPGPDLRHQWTGPRAKFLLSGLLSCSACGCRYEGCTQFARATAARGREKQLFYACGGYIRHGRSVCQRGAIPIARLESAIIDALLAHYAPLASESGLPRIEKLLRGQLESEHVEDARSAAKARKRLEQIDGQVRSLLDHLSERNREVADRHIAELSEERTRIEQRLESVTRAALAIERVGSLAECAHESLRSLEPILRSGPAEERAAAIRRCVERAVVEFDAKRVKVFVRALPMDAEGPLAMGVEEVEARLDAR